MGRIGLRLEVMMGLAKYYTYLLLPALLSALWTGISSNPLHAATPDCGVLQKAIAEANEGKYLKRAEKAASDWLETIRSYKTKRNKAKQEKEKKEAQADDDLRDYGCYRQKRAGKFNPEDNCEEKFENRKKLGAEYENYKRLVKSATRERKIIVDLIEYYKKRVIEAKRIFKEKCTPADALDVFDPVREATKPPDEKTPDSAPDTTPEKSSPPSDPCDSDPIWCGKRAECDRDKIRALLGQADALSRSKKFKAAEKIYREVKANYSHCPYVWDRSTTGVIDQIIGEAIANCDLKKMRQHLGALLRRSQQGDFVKNRIAQVKAALERCKNNPTRQTSTGTGGGSGPTGPRSSGPGGGGLFPPGATCTVAFAYAPGGSTPAGSAPTGNTGPSCTGDCPPLLGWKLPQGARCGTPQAPASPKTTTNQCPPGQHWSKDLQRCHSSG